MPEKNNVPNMHDIALTDTPTHIVEQYLLGWTAQLERYKEANNCSAIEEAQRLISEFQRELEKRRKEQNNS